MSTLLAQSLIRASLVPLLADGEAMAWGILLFCIILGLMVALMPVKRTTEIKKLKED
jgi:hypothetical protein